MATRWIIRQFDATLVFRFNECNGTGVTEPIKRIWIITKLKLLKNLFRLWGIFLPNLRILSRKNNEPTPFILFLAMNVTMNTSDRPNVSLVHLWKSIKKRFSLAKKKIQLYRSTHANLPVETIKTSRNAQKMATVKSLEGGTPDTCCNLLTKVIIQSLLQVCVWLNLQTFSY